MHLRSLHGIPVCKLISLQRKWKYSALYFSLFGCCRIYVPFVAYSLIMSTHPIGSTENRPPSSWMMGGILLCNGSAYAFLKVTFTEIAEFGITKLMPFTGTEAVPLSFRTVTVFTV